MAHEENEHLTVQQKSLHVPRGWGMQCANGINRGSRYGDQFSLYIVLKLNIYIPFQEPSWNPEREAELINCLYQLGKFKIVNFCMYYVQGKLDMNMDQVPRRKRNWCFTSFKTSRF